MIICVGHEKGVGKDTFNMYLTDILRAKPARALRIVREGFADRLYDVCHTIYGWAGFKDRQHYVKNYYDKEITLPFLGKSPRDILIEVGNHMREYDPQCWYRPVLTKEPGVHCKIIPDLRKVNEFEAAEAMGALRVKLVRGEPSTKDSDVDLQPIDPSRWTVIIDNNGTFPELRKKVLAFVDQYVWPNIQKEIGQ